MSKRQRAALTPEEVPGGTLDRANKAKRLLARMKLNPRPASVVLDALFFGGGPTLIRHDLGDDPVRVAPGVLVRNGIALERVPAGGRSFADRKKPGRPTRWASSSKRTQQIVKLHDERMTSAQILEALQEPITEAAKAAIRQTRSRARRRKNLSHP